MSSSIYTTLETAPRPVREEPRAHLICQWVLGRWSMMNSAMRCTSYPVFVPFGRNTDSSVARSPSKGLPDYYAYKYHTTKHRPDKQFAAYQQDLSNL